MRAGSRPPVRTSRERTIDILRSVSKVLAKTLRAARFRHWRIFRSWCAGSVLAKCRSRFRFGSDLRDPLVVTLDRLFVSRHVKTWDNRVRDTANLSSAKNGWISRGLYCTNLSFLAQLLGHVLEMYSTCTRKYFLLSQDEKSSVYSNSKLKKYRISCSENRFLNVFNRVSSFYYMNMFISGSLFCNL